MSSWRRKFRATKTTRKSKRLSDSKAAKSMRLRLLQQDPSPTQQILQSKCYTLSSVSARNVSGLELSGARNASITLSSWTSMTYFRRARRVENNLPNDAGQPNNDTQQSQAMNRTSESSFEVGQAGGDQQADPINSNDRCKFLSHCGQTLVY